MLTALLQTQTSMPREEEKKLSSFQTCARTLSFGCSMEVPILLVPSLSLLQSRYQILMSLFKVTLLVPETKEKWSLCGTANPPLIPLRNGEPLLPFFQPMSQRTRQLTLHPTSVVPQLIPKDGKTPGYFHTAILTELPHSGTIYYQFGNPIDGWSSIRSFKALSPPSADAAIRISIVADMGVSQPDKVQYHWQEEDAYQTIGHVTKLSSSTDLVLHIGDIAYATGYAPKWDMFMDSIEPVASTIPYMVTQGNHERDWPGSGTFFDGRDSGGECGVPTQHRFRMPKPSEDKTFWYSFQQGSVHFAFMDTEMPCGRGSPQHTWIQNDLANVNRSLTPWIIFSGHRPMYTIDDYDGHFADIEELLFNHKVDLVLWGHVHYAFATCPVYKKQCIKPKARGEYDAPIHTVIGNGGQGLAPIPLRKAPYSLYEKDEWGYERILVHNSTHLTMQFYANHLNTLHHSFQIVRAFPRK